MLSQKTKSAAPKFLLVAAIGLVRVGNIGFVADLYRFLSRYGGAPGTYGTALRRNRKPSPGCWCALTTGHGPNKDVSPKWTG